MIRIALVFGLLVLSACGAAVPASPGHEPMDASTNPITGTRGSSNH